MGFETLEAGTTEVPQDAQSTFKIISFKGSELPANYTGVILARWLRSFYRLNDYFKLADPEAYFREYERFIKAIIARPNVVIKLAALSEDIDVVFGWGVSEGSVLHYVHVQEPYRNQKMSYDLMPEHVDVITHMTKHWIKCFSKSPKNKLHHVKFNPFHY